MLSTFFQYDERYLPIFEHIADNYNSNFLLASMATIPLLISQSVATPVAAKKPKAPSGPSVISFKGLFPKYFPGETDCCESWGPDCRVWTQEDAEWMACAVPGDYALTQDDANAMKCLSNRHWSTPYTCIDVAPDTCGYGGSKVGGEITSAHIWNDLLGGSGKAGPISMDVDRTIQGGADAMVGTKIQIRDHNSIVIVKRDRNAPLSFGAGLEWFGQRGRSC